MNLSARDLTGRCGQASVDATIQLGRGATATVHPARLNGLRYAAKIFHEDRVFPTAKIVAMLANPPKALSGGNGDNDVGKLAWPTAILSDDRGRDVGFLMPELDLKVAYPLDYFYDQTLFKKLKSPNEAALSFKLEIARNLSRLVAELHDHGHCFIDMKPQNIRVTLGSHEVCLLDCDGFSIAGPQSGVQITCLACGAKNRVPTARLNESPTCGKCGRFILGNATASSENTNVGTRFPAELLSTDYISPEAFRGNTPPSALGVDQDRYALAVLLFQLLNRGTHPFQGIPKDSSVDVATNDEKAARGLYPHGRTPHTSISPRPQSIHELFDDGLRDLFDQAFVGKPGFRPTANDWADKFDVLLDSKTLVRCDKFLTDVSHMRFRDKQCPACYLASIPVVRVTPTKVDKTKSIEVSAPTTTRGPVPSKNPTFGSDMLVGIAVAAFLLFILAQCSTRSDPPATAPAPAPAAAPAPTPAVTCRLDFSALTPKQICESFWENRIPQCDDRMRSELERRKLQVSPSTSCGRPIQGAKLDPEKGPIERLAGASPGVATINRSSISDASLWISAVNSIVDRLRTASRSEDPATATVLHKGVSIRPFTSMTISYGNEGCGKTIETAGVCTQEPSGLLCGLEMYAMRGDRTMCITSFSR